MTKTQVLRVVKHTIKWRINLAQTEASDDLDDGSEAEYLASAGFRQEKRTMTKTLEEFICRNRELRLEFFSETLDFCSSSLQVTTTKLNAI